jgi:cardiolipin hydrolase
METNVFFSPGDECVEHIIELIQSSIDQLDICVFTISDDRITRALVDAHKNNVVVRIISDNTKAQDKGSDINDLARAGVSIKLDTTDNHMHHKFMVVDQKVVLTGSYNWTRSAALYNQENVVSFEDEIVAVRFFDEFEKLWETCEEVVV